MAFLSLVGLAWTVKGLVSLGDGKDGGYWGVDFVYGPLFLAAALVVHVARKRRVARR